MPRETWKPLTGQEQKFVFHYLREGGVEENAWIAEKKARLAKGTAAKFLKRKHIVAEIARRKAQVELEQAKVIARDQAKLAAETDKRQSVTLDKLERKLDQLLELDPKKHGALVLSAIHTGLVYTGTIRNGRIERVAPVVTDVAGGAPGNAATANTDFYASVFDRMRSEQTQVAAPIDPSATEPPPDPPPLPVPVLPPSPTEPSSPAPPSKPYQTAIT